MDRHHNRAADCCQCVHRSPARLVGIRLLTFSVVQGFLRVLDTLVS